MIENPETCAECKINLNGYFWYCRDCNKYLCYDCMKLHINHAILHLKSIGELAKVLSVSEGAAGGEFGGWPGFSIDGFTKSYCGKCPHAREYFKNSGIIFFCYKCDLWICISCLPNHEDHGPMPHIKMNNEYIRQIYPWDYSSNLDIDFKAHNLTNKRQVIPIYAQLKNNNEEFLYDVSLSYCIDNFQYHTIKTFETLKPNEIKEIKFEVNIPKIKKVNNSFIINLSVFYRDIFMGQGSKEIELIYHL